MPVTYIPAPIAIPIPTVAHSPAEVVSPTVFSFLTNMAPAPRKPIAVTTPATILDASSDIPSYPTTSKKPYFETAIMSAEEIATRIWVSIPAFFALLSLSIPMSDPHIAAMTIRMMLSDSPLCQAHDKKIILTVGNPKLSALG